MVTLISFSTLNFFTSQTKLEISTKKYGVDRVIKLNHLWLKRQTDFYQNYIYKCKNEKGFGYWIWKPYIISRALQNASNMDYIVYSDAGINIVENINPLISLCENNMGLALFQIHGRFNREWTKRDCFYFMNCDNKNYHDASQVMGSFMIIKNNPFTNLFVSEWLSFCLDSKIVSDDVNVCGLPNLPGFIAHRHDQSVLSLLAEKYKINLFRDPSQSGNQYKIESLRVEDEFLDPAFFQGKYSPSTCKNSLYPTTIDLHRQRNFVKKNSLIIRCKYFFNSFNHI